MVMRDVPTDTLKKKTLCVVSPVVGLLSYKAQVKFKLYMFYPCHILV